MTRKIQIKRGNAANLPVLESGEFGLTLDEKKLYIGHSEGNISLAKEEDVAKVESAATHYITNSVSTTSSDWHYEFNIPDFVYKNGCKVTGVMPTASHNGSMYLRVKSSNGMSEWFNISDINRDLLTLDNAWGVNVPVTFTLSDVVVATYKTAFLQSQVKLVNDIYDKVSDAPKIVIGSYKGSGGSQFVDLGFTPKAVLVVEKSGFMGFEDNSSDTSPSNYYYGGLALTGVPCSVYVSKKTGRKNIVEIVENGFKSYRRNWASDGRLMYCIRTDEEHYEYNYVALK